MLLLRSEHNKNVQIVFGSHDGVEGTEYENFKRDEVSYVIVKRSADGVSKKAFSVDQKKHFKKTLILSGGDRERVDASTKITSSEASELFLEPTFPPNTTVTPEEGYHVYYNSTFFKLAEQAQPLLVDFQNLPEENITDNKLLSDSYRRASTVQLSFDFPFYGHLLRNITIATGGFLYMDEYEHSWLAATQYVAPLMANFDTRLKNESMVRYFDNGTAFTVQWNNVLLQDRENDGPFTFQVTLMKNGKIIFGYEKIPLSVIDIANHSHPVKVGISDAYTINRTIYFTRRKTIYEYNRIDMKRDEIGNFTAILFTPLPTCLSFNDCQSCTTSDIGFDCTWCNQVKRCSDGLDRYRQEWLKQNCNRKKEKIKCIDGLNITEVPPSVDVTNVINHTTENYNAEHTLHPFKSNFTSLPNPESTPVSKYKIPVTNSKSNSEAKSSSARVGDEEEEEQEEESSAKTGGTAAAVVVLGVLIATGTWILYAYRNPLTPSGQFLIRYRPGRWHFGRGEARYTAASVHM